MIYLVSNKKSLFDNELFQELSVDASINMLNSWNIIQFDTETTGRNPHLCDILLAQFGNKKANIQIVVDVSTINFLAYKEILESKLIVGHNLKFDSVLNIRLFHVSVGIL